MDKTQQIVEMMKLPNIGEVSAERLVNAGVTSPEMLREIGAEEAYLKLFEKEGWGTAMHTCFLYAIEGAISGEKWNRLPEDKREKCKKIYRNVRSSLPY